ncbi:MAG: hypothetical protein A3B13_03225 [Candidatus Liptonbacteria bacterium RIFCSPLOWO2_01_FULL_45_15]|uniref:HIT domain-containing protein n=1 Tax=Candidatus Liptonbacteria bacterium RIFCSPLOWO2_01_FULL_45_15 TaxID=1798649 RepID=A0A1G2CIQ7_9BACT|nr:MAG: hypothetical protein A3B13_03225 [Candidatus Liptonbacteria bacterium RIFCSPLOWO2_01_FULL_45_15]
MTECIFCRIGKKEIEAETVYEDEDNMAILDIYPRAPGHTMVIPKVHRETILDAEEREIKSLFAAVKKATTIISKTLKPEGFTIGINHGKYSGQEIEHLHIHIIPRYLNDKGSPLQSVVDNKSGETVQETAAKIRKQTIINE